MIRKDDTVQCQFDPVLADFLFWVDDAYRYWDSELVITSGSEEHTRHSRTSLHYAQPARAVDIRIWERDNVPNRDAQLVALLAVVNAYCREKNTPINWIEVILESNHIHIEYQPKRRNHG